jgi:TRAP transporter TAXI family solute receptor
MQLFRLRVVIFLLCAAITSCGSQPHAATDPAHAPVVTFVGISRVTEPFAKFFAARLPDMAFPVKPGSAGMLANVDYLQSGLADVTFTQSDIAYTALTKGTEANPGPHTSLRGLAVTWMVALHLVVGPGIDFHTLEDLRGKRIGVGLPGGGTGISAQIILANAGLLSDVHLVSVTPSEVPSYLADGRIDAEIITGAYPADLVTAALATPGVRLVPIQGPAIAELKDKYPFLRPVIIPANTYGQAADIHTVGVDVLFVCRESLSEEIAYRMLTAFFDGIQDLAQRQPVLRSVTLSQAPATPIPLHPGAARFYRERELFN